MPLTVQPTNMGIQLIKFVLQFVLRLRQLVFNCSQILTQMLKCVYMCVLRDSTSKISQMSTSVLMSVVQFLCLLTMWVKNVLLIVRMELLRIPPTNVLLIVLLVSMLTPSTINVHPTVMILPHTMPIQQLGHVYLFVHTVILEIVLLAPKFVKPNARTLHNLGNQSPDYVWIKLDALPLICMLMIFHANVWQDAHKVN